MFLPTNKTLDQSGDKDKRLLLKKIKHMDIQDYSDCVLQ